MHIMSSIQSTENAARRNKAAGRLRALRLENYRKTRWEAIDEARRADMTWEEIGEDLGVMASAASRIYRNDDPRRQND